jgi:23S rRNA (adenine2503-C2)-methyltransferase
MSHDQASEDATPDGPSPLDILALTCAQVAAEMERRYGRGLHHAAGLCREVFKRGQTTIGAAPEFGGPAEWAERLRSDLWFPPCRIAGQLEDGGVVKFVTSLADRRTIESVVIPSNGRSTLCVSSQVGCAMGCTFCVTGAMGFIRQLEVHEIVWQVWAARFLLGCAVDNVVFMGMGEPLDNFDNVVQAIRVLSDPRGLDIVCRHITLSTAGHADGIRGLAGLGLPHLRLAVSINSANDARRSEIMPINKIYPLARVLEELRAFPLGKKGVVFVEYVLLAGVNDSRADAQALASCLRGIPVRVNVIPLNCGDSASAHESPGPGRVEDFKRWLVDEHLFVRLRRPRGAGAMAACGQLGAAGGQIARDHEGKTTTANER